MHFPEALKICVEEPVCGSPLSNENLKHLMSSSCSNFTSESGLTTPSEAPVGPAPRIAVITNPRSIVDPIFLIMCGLHNICSQGPFNRHASSYRGFESQ